MTGGGSERLEWSVLSRFTDYVLAMRDGGVLVEEGATRTPDGVFVFPLQSVDVDADQTTYSFGGVVQFIGHSGMLNVLLDAIRISVGGDDRARISIGDGVNLLELAEGDADRTAAGVIISPTLTDAGSDMFFGRYARGMALDTARLIHQR